MHRGTTRERMRDVGARLNSLVVRAIAAVVVLVMFAGLVFLVSIDRVDSDALLLYAGVILGYVVHATKQVI